jgi:hypothetical protein
MDERDDTPNFLKVGVPQRLQPVAARRRRADGARHAGLAHRRWRAGPRGAVARRGARPEAVSARGERDRPAGAREARAGGVEKLLSELTGRDFQRAKALEELKREIERDIANNPTFSAFCCAPSSRSWAAAPELREARHRVPQERGVPEHRVDKELTKQLEGPAGARAEPHRRRPRRAREEERQVLQKRVDAVRDIRMFLQRARGQMNLIENSVRLLRDQALTMTSPSS